MTLFRQKSLGFTLVELAIVIVVISLVIGMGLVASTGAIESAKRIQTENKMDAIEKALLAFRNQNNRLPCPGDPTLTASSTSYGLEIYLNYSTDTPHYDCDTKNTNKPGGYTSATTPPYDITESGDTDSLTVEGGVPTKTLNLPDEYMFDGWGRRFVYAVDNKAGTTNAFNIIPPSANDCSINVKDASGSNRTTGAIYALLSYGPNGHGGFVNGSDRATGPSINVDELTNCHCNRNAIYVAPTSATFIQKEPVEDISDHQNIFDDIVRYKERWQLKNEADLIADSKYKEYQLAINYSGDNLINFYKRGCHKWVTSSTASVNPASAVRGIGFTNDNAYFLYFHAGGGAPFNCHYYAISGSSLGAATSVPNSNCTAYNASSVMARSNNGYFAISYGSSPYVGFLRQTGSTFNLLTSAFVANPGAMPTVVAFSKNADYLFLSDKSTYAKIYVKVDDTSYRELPSALQPTGGTTCTGLGASCAVLTSAAFSPDGKYFAVGRSTTAPGILIWKIGTGSPFLSSSATSPFTALSFPPNAGEASFPAGGTTGPTITFSPDSQYLAGAGGVVNASTAITNVRIYKIDANDTFTTATVSNTAEIRTTPINTVPIFFTADSNMLLVPISSDGTNRGMAEFMRYDAETFGYINNTLSSDSPFWSTTSSQIFRMSVNE